MPYETDGAEYVSKSNSDMAIVSTISRQEYSFYCSLGYRSALSLSQGAPASLLESRASQTCNRELFPGGISKSTQGDEVPLNPNC